MATETTVRFIKTEAAHAAHPTIAVDFSADWPMWPVTGELLTLPSAPDATFLIAGRHFVWLTETHLEIQVVLDLPE